ncbi:MAG: DUF4214 domain-containing protein [Desulfobacteraceae bacterium]|nr:DUF4214 domain-containing protein [Desulfobacteraceae bacterium]
MPQNTFIRKKLKIVLCTLTLITLYSVTAWAGLTKTEVSQLYVSLFGRASEGEGNSYWGSEQNDMAGAANAMLATGAAKDYFGSSMDSNQAFIEFIYQNTLNKTSSDDAEGIAYWVGELNSKTRGEVAASLVGVIKNYAPGGAYYDANDAKTVAAYSQFTNRVTVSNYMADNVQTPPADWATSTSFNASLTVTDDMTTITTAQQAVDVFAGTVSGLENDIKSYMGMVSSAGELSPMMSELGTVFEEIMDGNSPVVTVTPALDTLNIANPPSSINITANFGSGYTPEGTTAVYTGQAVMNLTNISFSENAIGANATLTATNIKRDGQLVLNGGMSLSLTGNMSGNSVSATVGINFSNLQSLDSRVNGGISMTIPSISTDGQFSQPISATFNQLTTQDYTISGTVDVTPKGSNVYDALFNLTTNEGPIAGTVRMAMTGTQTVFSTPSGDLTAGEYTLDINDVTLDTTVCPEDPYDGNIEVKKGSETSTVVYNNCAYTIN